MSHGHARQVGVFVCHCGTNIAGIVDIEEVIRYANTLPNVSAKAYTYMCSEVGQNLIRENIDEEHLDAVVVAACSPRLHEKTFRKTISAGGLNPFLVEMANIREQDSWVHMKDPETATAKAKDLIRMAVGRASRLQPLEATQVPIAQSVLIIGGGIAGISAALDLAEEGFKVWLLEKSPTIGGNMARLDKTFPTMDCSACILTPRMSDTQWAGTLEILSYSELEEIEGYVGNFQAKVRQKPRYVDMVKCNACNDCVDVCPVSVPNEFDMGLAPRKAIYIPFPQAIPNKYTIDMDHCIKCNKCQEACKPEAIDFNDEEKIVEIDPGLIIIASGYQSYDPSKDKVWKYGKSPYVLTGLDMERLLNAAGPTGGNVVRADGKKPKSVAFLQCVGSRDIERNPWCSRVCCMYAIKHARMLREKYPDIQAHVYYMDIRSFGKGYEEFYELTQKEYGVKFIRGRVAEIIESPDNNNVILKAEDTLLGQNLALPYDMVVLSVGIEPNSDALDLALKVGISLSGDGFYLEAHPKLAPVDTATRGIFVCGAAQGPKDIPDAVAQAKAAASSAAMFLVKGSAEIEPFVPMVNESLCIACGICARACPYNALSLGPTIAEVNEALCHGCGSCASACPTGAIELKHFTDDQLLAQIEGILEESSTNISPYPANSLKN
ncbi:MAG: FAD-dependent oxidoreductase [Candidatus Hodarchaeales archaeon]|jgi:heterodisulfide reductase subunit A